MQVIDSTTQARDFSVNFVSLLQALEKSRPLTPYLKKALASYSQEGWHLNLSHPKASVRLERKPSPPVPPERSSTLLYRTHRTALVDYANGIVRDHARAEDVVQEAWERIEAVERGRTLTEPLRYFYRIVQNLALDSQRARKREVQRNGLALGSITETLADDRPTQEAVAAAREELGIVLDSMNELPERTRMALMLHTVEGLKLREVAERLGLSVTFTHQLVAEGKMHCIRRLSRRP